MKIRQPLVFAFVVVPLLAGCGSATPTTDWGPTGSSSSSGSSQGVEDGGNDSAGGGTMNSGPTPVDDAGAGGSSTDTGGAIAVEAGGGTTIEAGGGSVEAGVEAGGNDGAAGGSPDGGPIVTPAIKVVMYLPNWNGSFSSWATKIDFNKMTHLLLAFGTTNTSNAWDLGAADADVQTLVAAAHAKNVRVLVSIGGADDDIGIITQYQTASNIAPLVANLDAFCKRLGLDGVDVDLERGTDMKSSSNFPAFVSALLSTFHPEGKLVTSALAQYIIQDAGQDAAIFAVVKSYDFINDMIYTTNLSDYTNEANWWKTTVGLPNINLTWGIEFTGGLSASTATQIAMGSKAYGGAMIWEYTQPTEPQLWPAVQSAF